MTHDERDVRALLAEDEELLNASDAESIAGLYSADGIFMPQGFPTAAGREAVLQSYRAIFESITLKIELEVDEVVAGEGMATALTRSNGSVRVNATGAEAPESNRELWSEPQGPAQEALDVGGLDEPMPDPGHGFQS